MSSQYLQRLQIDSVEEVGVDNVQLPWYQQQVSVVEVVDKDGNPYEPSSWDNLVVDTKSSTTGSTVLGSVLTGTPATWIGGTPPVEPVSQWQRSADNTSWSGITPWSDNDQPKNYTTVLADQDMYVRYASKCTDAEGVVYGSGNSVGPMTPQTIAVTEPTVMTNGTFSNPTNAYLHETLTMYSATMVGGYGGITYEYRLQSMDAGTDTWTNLTDWVTTIPVHEVDQSDEGDKLRFQTKGTDTTGQTKTSNSGVTTVAVSTLIGTVTIGPVSALSADPGEMVGFTAANDGDADPMFIWAIRSGPALITSTYNFGPSVEVTINADATSGESVQVQVTADDPSATDTPQSTVATIVVN
jgi:hypothetical protein